MNSTRNTSPRLERWRMPLAMLLSFSVIVVWGVWQARQAPPAVPAVPVEEGSSELVQREAEGSEGPMVERSGVESVTVEPKAAEVTTKAAEVTEGVEDEGLVVPLSEKAATKTLQNEHLQVVLDVASGTVKSAALKTRSQGWVAIDGEFSEEEAYQTGEVNFYPFQSVVRTHGGSVGFREVGGSEREVVLSVGLQLTREYRVELLKEWSLDGHALRMKVRLRSSVDSEQPVKGFYYVFNGSGLGPKSKQANSYLDVVRLSYNELRKDKLETVLDRGFFSMFSGPKVATNITALSEWIAIDDRFHMRLLKPEKAVYRSSFRKGEVVGGLVSEEVKEAFVGAYKVGFDLRANAEHEATFSFYFLPKSRALLDKIYREDGEHFYNLFRQWSVLRVLSGWMYRLLEWIVSWAKNYGWSIVLMTLGLKAAIAPLTIRGQRSMQRIQVLGPKVNALRAQHKSDPKRANREIMELYRREKANPMGGCLPLLLPLPIFFALYSLFQNMVELRGEGFLWIRDLTEPDILFALPFALPFFGSGFHGLPFLMLITQLVQSIFLTPKPTPPAAGEEKGSAQSMMRQQAFLMKYFMPVFFFFICWSMPSALVLFWTVQNIFSIFQSMFFVKRPG